MAFYPIIPPFKFHKEGVFFSLLKFSFYSTKFYFKRKFFFMKPDFRQIKINIKQVLIFSSVFLAELYYPINL
jgi:hypothetical protein